MSEGRILGDGLTTEVFSQPDILQKAFLEPPQITQLAQSAEELGFFNPGTLTVEEMREQFEGLKVRQPCGELSRSDLKIVKLGQTQRTSDGRSFHPRICWIAS